MKLIDKAKQAAVTKLFKSFGNLFPAPASNLLKPIPAHRTF